MSFTNQIGPKGIKPSRFNGSSVILTKKSIAQQVPGVKEARKNLRSGKVAKKAPTPRRSQTEIQTAQAMSSIKGKVIAVHSLRQRVPEMRNLIFGIADKPSGGRTLLVEGMPPVLETGHPSYEHGSVLHDRKRYVLMPAHSIREGLALHEVKEILSMATQEVPAKLAMRFNGETVLLLPVIAAEGLPGDETLLTAYAPESAEGKVLAKAGALILEDKKVRSIGTRALAGSGKSHVQGFVVLGQNVVLGSVNRKSDDQIYVATIKEFNEALNLGKSLWAKFVSLRKETESLHRKLIRAQHLRDQIGQLRSALTNTEEAAETQGDTIRSLCAELGLEVPEIAVASIPMDTAPSEEEEPILQDIETEEFPEDGDDLLDMDIADGL